MSSSRHSSCSQSSVVLPLSDNEPGDNSEPGNDKSTSGCQNAGNESEPEEGTEITLEKELGV